MNLQARSLTYVKKKNCCCNPFFDWECKDKKFSIPAKIIWLFFLGFNNPFPSATILRINPLKNICFFSKADGKDTEALPFNPNYFRFLSLKKSERKQPKQRTNTRFKKRMQRYVSFSYRTTYTGRILIKKCKMQPPFLLPTRELQKADAKIRHPSFPNKTIEKKITKEL